MFNEIRVHKINRSTGAELERITVPISYGPKEKWVMRIFGDPDISKEVQVVAPRLAFEIVGLAYDSSRKQQSLLNSAKANTVSNITHQYIGVPYDISFNLSILSKTIDEANQIIEQIIPYFNPDYTISTNLIPEIGVTRDIPIILDSVNQDIQYEGGKDDVRSVIWDLSFTMKVYFYGPYVPSGIIRRVITQIYDDNRLLDSYIVRCNLGDGTGNFKDGDVVFQGGSVATATAAGYVSKWDPNSLVLNIGQAAGTFKINSNVYATSTNAVYQIASFVENPLLLEKIVITPDPITAGPEDSYGYDVEDTEYPEAVEE